MWLPAVVPKSGSGPTQNSGDTAAAHVLEAGFSGASRTISTVCRLYGHADSRRIADRDEAAGVCYAERMAATWIRPSRLPESDVFRELGNRWQGTGAGQTVKRRGLIVRAVEPSGDCGFYVPAPTATPGYSGSLLVLPKDI